ncbi:hypothetical protein JCGZ_26270 [Jatropha curcas]|uniref:QWRF motif-containing protein 7 n=1 Tax=Jatropha curcas TaxID=180498 RepID=A0A067JSB3_JATCU|nr:hypothetical protein JCGZ_26270 [Jatropha curcas]
MEYPLTRRNPPTPTPPSPRLVRSRSGSENNSTSINSSQRFTNRSKSTTRSSRNIPDQENVILKKPNNQQSGSKDGFVRFLQLGSPRYSPATNKRSKMAPKSPSAWALSPGRSMFNMFPPDSPAVLGREVDKVKGTRRGGGMTGVLKYFRQKRLSTVQEEEYRRFRVLHNRLLQWRFANAKTEASLAAVKIVAEDRLFHVWLRIFNARNTILEKRIEIQRVKHEIKLFQIINPQMNMLNDWSKIERKNCEAVGRVTRKLSALTLKLPLVEEAKGDVESIHKAMRAAVEVMDNMEATITKFLSEQVEKILYLLTELTSTLEHQKESLMEMETIVTLLAKLLEWEKSIRVQLMQVVRESRNEQSL